MDRFVKRWVVYCASGELLGIASAGIIAYGINHLIGEPYTFTQKLIVLFSMLIAGCIEGFFLGKLQWIVLKDKLPALSERKWVGYTMLVATLGWFLGMLPSLFLIDPEPIAQDQYSFDSPVTFSLLCISAGLVIGSIFGLFQWFALRGHLTNAYQWIIANALGWAAGLGWIYLAASIPDSNTSIIIIILLGITGGMLAGISVGAITGIFLKKLLGFHQ